MGDVPPLVSNALKVIGLPGQITGLFGVIETVGISNGFTVMVIPLLLAVAGKGQTEGSAVISTLTTFVLANVSEVYVEPVSPGISTPFSCHWYEIAVPAFALGVAVKVTDWPAQILVEVAELVTDGTTLGVTTIEPLMVALAQGPVAVMV
jgi:hypothetical protein